MPATTHIPHTLAAQITRALMDVRTWRDMGDTRGEEEASRELNDLLCQVPRG